MTSNKLCKIGFFTNTTILGQAILGKVMLKNGFIYHFCLMNYFFKIQSGFLSPSNTYFLNSHWRFNLHRSMNWSSINIMMHKVKNSGTEELLITVVKNDNSKGITTSKKFNIKTQTYSAFKQC